MLLAVITFHSELLIEPERVHSDSDAYDHPDRLILILQLASLLDLQLVMAAQRVLEVMRGFRAPVAHPCQLLGQGPGFQGAW